MHSSDLHALAFGPVFGIDIQVDSLNSLYLFSRRISDSQTIVHYLATRIAPSTEAIVGNLRPATSRASATDGASCSRQGLTLNCSNGKRKGLTDCPCGSRLQPLCSRAINLDFADTVLVPASHLNVCAVVYYPLRRILFLQICPPWQNPHRLTSPRC